jgi:hypothetical protein
VIISSPYLRKTNKVKLQLHEVFEDIGKGGSSKKWSCWVKFISPESGV